MASSLSRRLKWLRRRGDPKPAASSRPAPLAPLTARASLAPRTVPKSPDRGLPIESTQILALKLVVAARCQASDSIALNQCSSQVATALRV